MEYIKRNAKTVILGLPSKGRLKKQVIEFLAEKGFTVKDNGYERALQASIEEDPQYKVVFIHPKDVPPMLERRLIDVGFTGLDLIHETEVSIRPLIRIGRGYVKMGILVPSDSQISHPFHLLGKTVGTSFPKMAAQYFKRLKVAVKIQEVQGATEGMPYLGLVDAIVDVVETGSTAKANKLKVIDDEIFSSECVCAVHKPELYPNFAKVNSFLKGIY